MLEGIEKKNEVIMSKKTNFFLNNQMVIDIWVIC